MMCCKGCAGIPLLFGGKKISATVVREEEKEGEGGGGGRGRYGRADRYGTFGEEQPLQF